MIRSYYCEIVTHCLYWILQVVCAVRLLSWLHLVVKWNSAGGLLVTLCWSKEKEKRSFSVVLTREEEQTFRLEQYSMSWGNSLYGESVAGCGFQRQFIGYRVPLRKCESSSFLDFRGGDHSYYKLTTSKIESVEILVWSLTKHACLELNKIWLLRLYCRNVKCHYTHHHSSTVRRGTRQGCHIHWTDLFTELWGSRLTAENHWFNYHVLPPWIQIVQSSLSSFKYPLKS